MLDIKVIPTRGVLNPLRVVPEEKMDSWHGESMLNAIDLEISKSRFFKKQWIEKQSQWQPLDPEYVQEKVEAGLSPKIWKLSGATIDALSKPVMVNSSNAFGRRSTLVFNTGYAAECVWLIGYPAASGWPGHKNMESFFGHNQRTRPWNFMLDKATRDRCTRAAARSVNFFWKTMMVRYFGSRK